MVTVAGLIVIGREMLPVLPSWASPIFCRFYPSLLTVTDGGSFSSLLNNLHGAARERFQKNLSVRFAQHSRVQEHYDPVIRLRTH